ncbi:reverse transcriptase domain-containing protein [Priestia megaterium]|uniref:reverse transcriptase domain-containing protein n=1 Tax=Priestia megaterium TaxID=1404 RepID=UPI002D7E9E79|nr:reverse transcriptase domain-containing protein [Priestia megaterium]MEB4870169.1 reverse transcriptase domain-containing protein [Priestia megaterium]
MIKDPFGKEELYIAWMRCRYFIVQDISKFKIYSEINFYDEYIDQIILDLHHRLKNKQYDFSSKQVFLMPKNNGLLRRNSFMEIEDQIVSHAILNFIGKKIDSQFYYWSCANRLPKKKTNFSALTFVPYYKQYNRFLNHTTYKITKGNRWVCETDLVSYYDHIDHDLLTNMLKHHLKDEKYFYITEILIPSYLKSSYFLKGEVKKSDRGIPQGGALACFLSNLYLNELDHEMKTFTNHNYVRYVDDIRILGKTKKEVEKSLLHLQAHLWELGLEINAGKTKVYEIEDDDELEEFREEQKEKLSLLQEDDDEEMYRLFKKYKDIITENENVPLAKGEFKELEKLRKRKVNFAANNLIRKRDPESFPLLLSQMNKSPEKINYFLEKLFYYRFKEKTLNVLDINNSYLDGPYEAYTGAAVANLTNWGIRLWDGVTKFLPSNTGIIELYLLNISKPQKVDPLILTTIINKIFNNLDRANPYLLNSILYHVSRSNMFSVRFKSAIINKIIIKEIYRKSNCGQFIIDAFFKDRTLLEQFQNRSEEKYNFFFEYLRKDYRELYEILIAEDSVEEIVEPTEGYFTLENLQSTFNSLSEIYVFLKKIITLIKDNNYYINNPAFINPKNLWVKTSLYHDMEVKLNPDPVKDRSLYLGAPEDFLDRENVKNEFKISFMIGLITFSLLLKEMGKVNSLNLPYIQFNPYRIWKHNSSEFKVIFSKEIIDSSPAKSSFEELLNIIEKLTKKNPKSRLSIANFDHYSENKKRNEEKTMKFFISHSTKDKGRITPYIDLIQGSERKHKAIIDSHDFTPGNTIKGEIIRQIDESDLVIVFYSKNVVENFKWVIEEVEYSIRSEKPFICVLLDNIPLPPLLKSEEEKLHFVHEESLSIKDIQSFLYKLEGIDVEEINSKLDLGKEDPAYIFIQHLNEKEVPLEMLKEDDKYFNIFDALTKNKDCKLIPSSFTGVYLEGADINASPYRDYINNLKFLELIETQESGSRVEYLKLQNISFHNCIREAKKRYSTEYWKEYFKNAIKLELFKLAK